MPDTTAGQIYNQDIVGLYNRINRFITEAYRSSSSGLGSVSEFDSARILTYLNAIDKYEAWVVAQPHLDLPETKNRLYALEPLPVVQDIENESLWDLIHIFELERDELINSQSARKGSGLEDFDAKRLSAITAKARSFMTTYVATVDPLDLPASSPDDPQSPPAMGGV